MKRLRLLVFVCLLALTAGCVGPATFKSSPTGEGYVTLTINWDTLAASSPMRPASFSPMALTDNVAIIGARIVAPDINAVLSQSATRQTAETQGVITIPVPAVSNANLFAVAVDDADQPVMLGHLTGISVAESTVLTITSDQLTWITPDVYLTGEVKWTTPNGSHTETIDLATLESGTLTAPDEISGEGCGATVLCIATISVNIADPFGSTPAQPMICLGGFGTQSSCYQSGSPAQDGWQHAAIICFSTGAACLGTPYVNGTYFSLDDRYYFGGEFGPFTIDWKP